MPKKRKADIIHDDVLGEVKFRKRVSQTLDAYNACLDIDGYSVELYLYTNDQLDIMPTIERASRIVENYPKVRRDAKKFFRDEFLPHYKEVWQQPGSPKASASLFGKVSLIEITLSSEGITFTYGAGDLLGGHLLELCADDDLQFVSWDTPG